MSVGGGDGGRDVSPLFLLFSPSFLPFPSYVILKQCTAFNWSKYDPLIWFSQSVIYLYTRADQMLFFRRQLIWKIGRRRAEAADAAVDYAQSRVSDSNRVNIFLSINKKIKRKSNCCCCNPRPILNKVLRVLFMATPIIFAATATAEGRRKKENVSFFTLLEFDFDATERSAARQ